MTGLEDPRASTAVAPGLTGQAPTILIVDDEPGVRRFARSLLTANGFSVVEASNAAAALALCERHVGTMRLLLTDFKMPGLNGVELTTRVTARYPQIKVLFMTAFAADLAGEIGSDVRFLAKPFSEPELVEAVRRMLRPLA
jgi:CheY-like chemotaxis protein